MPLHLNIQSANFSFYCCFFIFSVHILRDCLSRQTVQQCKLQLGAWSASASVNKIRNFGRPTISPLPPVYFLSPTPARPQGTHFQFLDKVQTARLAPGDNGQTGINTTSLLSTSVVDISSSHIPNSGVDHISDVGTGANKFSDVGETSDFRQGGSTLLL